VLVPAPTVERLIEAEIERDKLKIKLDTFKRINAVERETYEDALKAKRKWYNNPKINRVGGFILGVIFTGVCVHAAGQLD